MPDDCDHVKLTITTVDRIARMIVDLRTENARLRAALEARERSGEQPEEATKEELV